MENMQAVLDHCVSDKHVAGPYFEWVVQVFPLFCLSFSSLAVQKIFFFFPKFFFCFSNVAGVARRITLLHLCVSLVKILVH